MTIIQVSEICVKKGASAAVPDSLNEAEIAFTTDTGDVLIGAPNLSNLQWRTKENGSPQYPYGNLRLLTELDYGKLISGDVALNTPLHNFNLVSTVGKTVNIGTKTDKEVPVDSTNPMPMFYLPPGANTAKMDLSIVNNTDKSISIVSLMVTGWGTSGNSTCKIIVNPTDGLPKGLSFYSKMNFATETYDNTFTDNVQTVVPDNALSSDTPGSVIDNSKSVEQIILAYVNSSSNTYTVYTTVVCWNSSSDGSAPVPGLSGIAAQSNVYANSNVINPAGTQGPPGKDGKDFVNDGSTALNAASITAGTATFQSLNVGGNTFTLPGLASELFSSYASSTLMNTIITNDGIMNTNMSNPIIHENNGGIFNFTNPIFFNGGTAGYFDIPARNLHLKTTAVSIDTGYVNYVEGTWLNMSSSQGIRFPASTSDSTKYYSIAYDTSTNSLNFKIPSDGILHTSGNVHFSGQTTLDDLIVKDLNANYITLESATIDIETTTINNVTKITSTVDGTGSILGWELVTSDYYTYLINMTPSGNAGGFRFLSCTGKTTITDKQYLVQIDQSGNIETTGGMLLGEGSTLTFSNKAGTGTIVIGYDEKQEVVNVQATGVVNGAFVFPDNITAESLTITKTLPVTDYSGNVPSTQWVKNYVESTKIDFTNDGTSNIFADNGVFSSMQINGLTTLQNATAITPIINDNSNNVATTAFVQENIQNYLNNVSLLGYVTAADVADTYISGKYGMATTDYKVASIFYSKENKSPTLIYKDASNTDNMVSLIDSTYASNNLVTQNYLKNLFPNDGTSSGNFLSLTTGTLNVSNTSFLAAASATTPNLTDKTNRVATCEYVTGQNYISGSLGIPSSSEAYYGQGLYYDLASSGPIFVYTDSIGKQNSIKIITRNYADSNYVSATKLTSVLSGYIKTSQIGQFVTSDVLSNYASNAQLSAYLKIEDANAEYAKQTDLDVYITKGKAASTYVSSSDFDSRLSDYVSTNQIAGYLTISSAQATYATISYVDQQLSNKNFLTKNDLAPYALTANTATMANVTSYLTTNGYITSGTLASYLTIANAQTTYVSNTQFSSTLKSYYTSSQCDNRYIIGISQSASLKSVTNIGYDYKNGYFVVSYNDTPTTTVTKNIVDKAYVDTSFVKKSTILPSAYSPWSASISFGGSTASMTINDSGYYIVGCICYVWLNATVTNLGSGTGNMAIGSLPANATGTYNFPLSISISKIYSTTLNAYVSNNAISVYGTNGTTTTMITDTNMSVGSTIVISGSYPINLV